ncbi:MAG: pyridoxal-dependent decarboxylase [Gemmatimonadota bacterium]
MPANPRDAQRAWFLGPRAENADLMERLVVEALRDHVFWRRNFHPEDGVVVSENDKRRPGYVDATGVLTQGLTTLLARLKQDLPFFSGRYLGHMLYEQTIAAQVGYFAAMLYNPNNVAAETSPATTALELEVAADLARMVGYPPASTWGHLTSGGTLANFEAIWIARNTHYLPLAVACAARALGVTLQATLPDGTRAPLSKLDLWQASNLDPGAALDLLDAFHAAVPKEQARAALDAHSLATMGYQDYSMQLARTYGDPLPAAVVLVAATAHYSWEKIVRALGIGGQQLRFVPVDSHCRMDPDALWDQLAGYAKRRTPVLALVSVCGTTEESAFDRLDHIVEVRDRARKELGLAFHLHSDACYGGYAAAVTWRQDGTRRTAEEIRRTTGISWPEEGWVEGMVALGETDSVSIDPHKLGYVPYAAGAFLLRDRRARELVALDPPYLVPTAAANASEERFLGRYSLEGSRPGASAAGTWLSHKVVPLHEHGYGHLIERTVVGARRLHAALAEADLSGCHAVMLPRPDLNIVNFTVRGPGHQTLAEVNEFNERLYRQLSGSPGSVPPPYFLTRTRLTTPTYDGAIGPLLKELGVGPIDAWRAEGRAGLVVLRMTVMNPFLADPPPAPDHIAGFVAHLSELCLALDARH